MPAPTESKRLLSNQDRLEARAARVAADVDRLSQAADQALAAAPPHFLRIDPTSAPVLDREGESLRRAGAALDQWLAQPDGLPVLHVSASAADFVRKEPKE